MSIWSGVRGLWRDRHYARGMVQYNQGRYAEAAAELERAVAGIPDPSNPDHSLGAFYAAEARLHLALASMRAGDLAAAEDHLRRAVAANPDYPDLRVHLAVVLERRGALGEAAAACREALRRNPEFRRAWIWLAVVADAGGDLASARDALGRAEALGAELPPGLPRDGSRRLQPVERQALRELEEGAPLAARHAELSLEHYARGDLSGALSEIERAVAAEPRYPDLRGRRASLLAELGRHAEAAEEWQRALALNPGFAEARFRLAVSLLAVGRAAEAAQAVLAAGERLPGDAQVLHVGGLILLCGGRPREAEAMLARAAGLSPGGDAGRLLGLCKLLDRELEEAERLCRAGAGAGNDADRSLDLAWLALKRGDPVAAAAALRAARGGGEERFEHAYGRAQAERARGRAREAEAAYGRALELAEPGSVERGLTLLGRGGLLLERGGGAPAVADLEEAARLLEDSAEAWLLLGRARRRDGAGAAAEAALRRAVDSYPGWPEALAELADFLTRAGRGVEAAVYWERVRRVDPLHPLARAHRGDMVRDAVDRAYGT